jgi:lipopolysaccharide transport system ATP-binding protein
MSAVIRVENLYKAYHLGQIGSGTLANDMHRWWAMQIRGKEDPLLKIGEANDRTRKGETDVVWALNNISFDVQQGEVLGIIGRNGAGKSTLLKILSRTTSPTKGEVKIKGRIASLLEVGTGFHPELTGRENIFLNGAILGMTKREIKSKFDEIVDFSGVERYIDTPVKRYSSGMYVRLAFAVAAHLEPEILIVDEVLAVGDAEFQKKAIGKMKDVSQGQGRTVLFVSHNMAAVQSLCSKGLVLANGEIAKYGQIEDVTGYYLNQSLMAQAKVQIANRRDRSGSGILRFQKVWFENETGIETNALLSGMSCFMAMELKNTSPEILIDVKIAVGIDDSNSRRLTVLDNYLLNQPITIQPEETRVIRIKLTSLPFQSNVFYYTLFCSIHNDISDWITHAGEFFVEEGDYFKTGRIIQKGQGAILIDHEFVS